MDHNEIELHASIGALKAVVMSLIVVTSVQIVGENEERQQSFIDDLKQNVLEGVSTSYKGPSPDDANRLATRMHESIVDLFDNISVRGRLKGSA